MSPWKAEITQRKPDSYPWSRFTHKFGAGSVGEAGLIMHESPPGSSQHGSSIWREKLGLGLLAFASSEVVCIHDLLQVKDALPTPNADALPNEWIVVKDFRRKNWKAKHWQGQFQILLTTPIPAKRAVRVTWIHTSHCN